MPFLTRLVVRSAPFCGNAELSMGYAAGSNGTNS